MHFQLIVSGQDGEQLDLVLKLVVVEPKDEQEPKLGMKGMVDLVMDQVKNINPVIAKTAHGLKVSFHTTGT